MGAVITTVITCVALFGYLAFTEWLDYKKDQNRAKNEDAK